MAFLHNSSYGAHASRHPIHAEFNILSAEELTLSRHPLRRNGAFVTVRADPTGTALTTTVDRDGGSYPRWNEKLVVALPLEARGSVSLEVRCKTPAGTKLVGKAAVPLSDFYGGLLPTNYLHFLSYRLRDEKGERNGIVNFSVRVCVQEPERWYVPRPLPASPSSQVPWVAPVISAGYY